jgi:regulator of RNase E activity RraA
VRWSFRVARGSLTEEMLAAAGQADLVIADIEQPQEAGRAITVRVVRAGDSNALRAAMEEGDGILVLAGADNAIVGETLRKLIVDGPT